MVSSLPYPCLQKHVHFFHSSPENTTVCNIGVRAVGRILLGWVRGPEAWVSRGDPGIFFPEEFRKVTLKLTFPAF